MVNYSVHDNARLDRIFKALSDPTRRAIVAQLARGAASAGELAAPFDMTLPAITKHLKVLESAGLLVRDIDGRVHRCRLDAHPMEEAEAWIERHRTFWNQQLGQLAAYLAGSRSPSRARVRAHKRRR